MSQPRAFGRYQLGRRVAVGGMGEVFLATQSGPMGFEKPLALKLLLPHLGQDAQGVESFLAEGRLVARMNHPNVVQVLDMGREGERYYLAMELVVGVSLWRLITRLQALNERPSPDLVCHVARSLCEGLDYAHNLTDAAGGPLHLVHRDVSPQNVLVSINGDVKLADFGIAKARDSLTHTVPGLVKGKLEYLAPEALEGGPVDFRVDLFGAGTTVYAFAALNSPFHRESPSATMQAVERDEPPPLSSLREDLPTSLVTAVARAMSKRADGRFTSARAFREELPPPLDDARAALGSLVRRVCAADLEGLGERAAAVSARTATLDERPTEPTTRPAGRRPSRFRAMAGAAVGLLGALGLLLLAVGLSRSSDTPRPIPAPMTLPPPSPAGEVPPTASPLLPEHRVEPTRPRVSRSTAPKASAPGRLDIDATPWAIVYINGKRAGETPLAGYPVEPGQVRVVLHNPESRRRVTRSFQVAPGGRISVKEDLQ